MAYTKDDYLRNYERLSDDELEQVLADKKDLVPEAVAALEIEVQRRHVTLPSPPQWTRSAERSEPVQSLEDYEDYTQLRDKNQFVRRWGYLIAIGPFLLVLVVSRGSVDRFEALVVVAVVWAMVWAGCGTMIHFRYMMYKCPQCTDRFGGGKECRSCGFPRSKALVSA